MVGFFAAESIEPGWYAAWVMNSGNSSKLHKSYAWSSILHCLRSREWPEHVENSCIDKIFTKLYVKEHAGTVDITNSYQIYIWNRKHAVCCMYQRTVKLETKWKWEMIVTKTAEMFDKFSNKLDRAKDRNKMYKALQIFMSLKTRLSLRTDSPF